MNQGVAAARAAALACALLADWGAAMAGPAQPAPVEAESCNPVLAARYIGARAVPAVRGVIRAVAGLRPIRWIRPGQPITPDLKPQRLNVIIDDAGRIMAMRCG
jgi:Peptidase inhibitor I78 family